MSNEAIAREAAGLDPQQVRPDFPGLEQSVHGRPLVYLDNAATTQRARPVLDAVQRMERDMCANVHRGVHKLSADATDCFEAVRTKVRHFLNAESERGIVFTRGTTESINLVAQSFGRTNVREGDEVLVTEMEHHSNIVPWQMLCEHTGAKLRVLPMNDRGELKMEELPKLLSSSTKLVGLVHVSNALGTINPVAEVVRAAHEVGAKVLVDGAQASSHLAIDVQALDADFYALSAHKVFGPTGVGVLYAKPEILEAMPPWQGGGEMIRVVRFDETTYNEIPHRFEAGTPNIEGVVGLGAAIDYVLGVGLERIAAHERALLDYATTRMAELPGIRLLGTANDKAAVLSFVFEQAHAHDIGTILDHQGVAVRTGHHCAMPVMQHFGVEATTRASFALYNTKEEIDVLVEATAKALAMLS